MRAAVASTLIFDLDGTISDPSQGIGRCFAYALEAHGLEPVSDEQVTSAIGPPLDESFRGFCPGADEATILSLVAKYRERYGEVGYAENRLYPGVESVLQALSSGGTPLAVCTSKRADFAKKILAMFGLLSLFRFVDGGDVGIGKGDQLAALLERREIDRSSIMIGDRAVDVAAAKANGLRSVGVLWGFGGERELREAGPETLLRSTSELAGLGLQVTP